MSVIPPAAATEMVGTSADLDGHSARAQQALAENAFGALRLSARDGHFHTYATGATSDSGRWLFIFATGPDTPKNRDHLNLYLRAKKHQEQPTAPWRSSRGPTESRA